MINIYVDKTYGTDDIEHGAYPCDGAVASLSYAWSRVPNFVEETTQIIVSNDTYCEDFVPTNKVVVGNSYINIIGTLTQLATGTIQSSVKGTKATQGSITGSFTGMANKLLYANGEYRIIDSVTDNVATICGCWSGIPTGTYIVYDWGTKIQGTARSLAVYGQRNISFQNIDISGAPIDIYANNASSIWMYHCKVGGYAGFEVNTQVITQECLFTNNGDFVYFTSGSQAEMVMSKVILTNAIRGVLVDTSATLYIDGGCVIDGLTPAGNFGIYCRNNAMTYFDPSHFVNQGYARIRNCVYGTYSYIGGKFAPVANNVQFSGCTQNTGWS